MGYFAYNFIEIHRTPHKGSAMVAGVTDRLWFFQPGSLAAMNIGAWKEQSHP